MATPAKLPSRLHHTAYVTRDLEGTRKFYEELIGLPLVATWCEKDELFGAERVYCHLFFALADGGALAFFKFANKGDEELFGPKMPDSPFHHIALNVDQETQQGIEGRLKAAGYKEPRMYVLEHGSAQVGQFRYSPVTGALTPLSPAFASTGAAPFSAGISANISNTNWVFVTNTGASSISGFGITSGKLVGLSSGPILVPGQPTAILVR